LFDPLTATPTGEGHRDLEGMRRAAATALLNRKDLDAVFTFVFAEQFLGPTEQDRAVGTFELVRAGFNT